MKCYVCDKEAAFSLRSKIPVCARRVRVHSLYYELPKPKVPVPDPTPTPPPSYFVSYPTVK